MKKRWLLLNMVSQVSMLHVAYKTAVLTYINPASEYYTTILNLLDESKQEIDEDARYSLLSQVQEITLDNNLQLILCQGLSFGSYNEKVQGLQWYYYGAMNYTYAWISE